MCTEVGWKMINLSVTDRAGQSGSRERGPDRKVERSARGILEVYGGEGDPMILNFFSFKNSDPMTM